jgi:16S rRNA (cytosine967-C5)-methyltransferase
VSATGVTARRVAIDALTRIDRDGAYANLALSPLLDRSGLPERDRAQVTDLVYGTTRMRRACAWLVERFLTRAPDPDVRAALHVGAYQLVFARQPPHAAVSATVEAVPKRARGFVNAVLRRVADAGPPTRDEWPSDAVRLSYPDWIVDWARAELGDEAEPFLEQQNRPPSVTTRPDGYVQDRASQWVVEAVGARPDDRVVDICAAPGGKATLLAEAGAHVVALDVHPRRAALVKANAARVGSGDRVAAIVADGRTPPLVAGAFDRVLVDAPCSGLGVLRRRPDARWRVVPDDVVRLAVLQQELVAAALGLLQPGGTLVYSVCTLTSAETTTVDDWLAAEHADLTPLPIDRTEWRPRGRGGWLLPQWHDTDGMFVLALRAPEQTGVR